MHWANAPRLNWNCEVSAQFWSNRGDTQTPNVPTLGPVQDFGRFSGSHRAPYTALLGMVGLILLPSPLGTPAMWGADCPHQCLSDLCHCHPQRIRNACPDIKCDFILGDNRWFFKSLVGQIMVCDPPWGCNPTFLRDKNPMVSILNKVFFHSFLATKASQSVLHSDCFNWFIHISLQYKRFQTAKWS